MQRGGAAGASAHLVLQGGHRHVACGHNVGHRRRRGGRVRRASRPRGRGARGDGGARVRPAQQPCARLVVCCARAVSVPSVLCFAAAGWEGKRKEGVKEGAAYEEMRLWRGELCCTGAALEGRALLRCVRRNGWGGHALLRRGGWRATCQGAGLERVTGAGACSKARSLGCARWGAGHSRVEVRQGGGGCSRLEELKAGGAPG
eukprot:364331-Chlamydomonas_euryale.AAC.11